MDSDLYDEFGNYVGPDLDSDDDEDDGLPQQQQEEDDDDDEKIDEPDVRCLLLLEYCLRFYFSDGRKWTTSYSSKSSCLTRR